MRFSLVLLCLVVLSGTVSRADPGPEADVLVAARDAEAGAEQGLENSNLSAEEAEKKFKLGLSWDKERGLGVSGGISTKDGRFAVGGEWNKQDGLSARLGLGQGAEDHVFNGGRNNGKEREAAAEQCASLQARWKQPGSDGNGCEHDSQARCQGDFYRDVESLEVGEASPQVAQFMERCCHVWNGQVNERSPFSDKPCAKGPTAPPVYRPNPKAVKLCVEAQDRWRKGGGEDCDNFRECSLAFSQEVQKFSEDEPEVSGDMERCCFAWAKPPTANNPFASERCMDLPKGGVDVSNGRPASAVRLGDPSGSVQRARDKINRLKAKLNAIVKIHKKCNKRCKAHGRKCHKVCCQKLEKARGLLEEPQPHYNAEDVHLVHRAIVAWVRRLVTTVERVAEHDDVPPVIHAMAKVFCRKIQLRFNPTACVSGKRKCHIKFRDAIGVLKFPGGPRFPPSLYTKFIENPRDGRDVSWCRFDWDEQKAAAQARKLAKKRLKDALRRVALAKARMLAARSAAQEKDQEEGDLVKDMDLSSFVVLAPGAKGPDAVALRLLLRAAQLFTGKPVGDYTGEAVKVVEKLQERRGLRDDGVVTGEVWKILVEKHTLRKWRKNSEEAVRALQYLLKFKYGKQLKVCGVYNRETAAIVTTLQKQHGLPVTGAVGAREWPLLLTDLNEVPRNMSKAQCHRKMGMVLGAEKAKSGRDCLETEVFAMECCRIRSIFNCDRRTKEQLAKGLLECRNMDKRLKRRKAAQERKRKLRLLLEKAAMAAAKLQKCGPCKFVTLHVGDKGPEVAALRYLLEEWEILPQNNEAVEVFDATLTRVVKKLQKDKGMIPTGVVGTQTWLRLIGPEFLWKYAKFDRAIRALQYILKRKFGAPLAMTGEYDDNTEKAVRAFQRAQGIKVDGMVGGHTWSALLGHKGKGRILSRINAARAQAHGNLMFVTLSKGDEGAAVAAMKYLLKEHSLMASNNAEFDDSTVAIVNQYRERAHVKGGATGQCGPEMWMSLISAGPNLRRGVARPDAVRAVQYLLKHKYGVALTVDGQFGPETDKVVREFQVGNAIPEDGIVGPVTWQRLLPADNEPDARTRMPRARHLGPYKSKFTSIQTEGEIQEEVAGLVRAVGTSLPANEAAKEICSALQAKFNAPSRIKHRPGCLDGKMHCAEGFYLSIGAIKRITSYGSLLSSCKHRYEGDSGPYSGREYEEKIPLPTGDDQEQPQPPPHQENNQEVQDDRFRGHLNIDGDGVRAGVSKGSFNAGLEHGKDGTRIGLGIGKFRASIGI